LQRPRIVAERAMATILSTPGMFSLVFAFSYKIYCQDFLVF
jgi:hypothetical protein